MGDIKLVLDNIIILVGFMLLDRQFYVYVL